MKVDRELLKDMGFTKGTGFACEVWIYQRMFWVHFENNEAYQSFKGKAHMIITDVTRAEFFKMLFETIQEHSQESNDYGCSCNGDC